MHFAPIVMTKRCLQRAISSTMALALFLPSSSIYGRSLDFKAKTSQRITPYQSNEITKRMIAAYGQLPLSFEANQGQINPEVKFRARGSGYSLFLTRNEAMLSLSIDEKKEVALRMKLIAANPDALVTGEEELPGKSNYFRGNDPQNWQTGVTNYKRVHYQGVYPGIDLVYYGKQGQLEYDFIVAPGANPNQIKFQFDGIEGMKIDQAGDLVLKINGGELRQHRPVIYQEVNGIRQEVGGRFVVLGKREVGFELDKYDPKQVLVIDPVIAYSTFIAGRLDDLAMDVVVDNVGNAYIVGTTKSINFPTAPKKYINRGAKYDAFIVKLNASGTDLLYSAVIGGTNEDYPMDIAIDDNGCAYIIGWTLSSADFPRTMGAVQTAFGGGTIDAFVTKLNPSGTGLAYSSFLGGDADDYGSGIAVDNIGNAYVVGCTHSLDYRTTLGAFQPSSTGPADGFLTKIDPAGSTRIYSTFLGGSNAEQASAVAVDRVTHEAYVFGDTNSTDFPFIASPFAALPPRKSTDLFVMKFDASGSGLHYSSVFGGSLNESSNFGDIAIDSAGNAYVVGYTYSSDFPTTPNALQIAYGGKTDAVVVKLNPSGDERLYSSFLGGSELDLGHGIAVDASENAYVTGITASTNFPITRGAAIQPDFKGPNNEAFVTKIDTTSMAMTLSYSSFLGGTGFFGDRGNGIAVDDADNVYVVGDTDSGDFPVTSKAFQTMPGGGGLSDGFVTKIAFGNVCPIMAFTPMSLPNARIGCHYFDQVLSVTGGTAPYTFKVTLGALPPWLSLSPDGKLTGGFVPFVGNYFFTITATDASGCKISQDYLVNASQEGPCVIPIR